MVYGSGVSWGGRIEGDGMAGSLGVWACGVVLVWQAAWECGVVLASCGQKISWQNKSTASCYSLMLQSRVAHEPPRSIVVALPACSLLPNPFVTGAPPHTHTPAVNSAPPTSPSPGS